MFFSIGESPGFSKRATKLGDCFGFANRGFEKVEIQDNDTFDQMKPKSNIIFSTQNQSQILEYQRRIEEGIADSDAGRVLDFETVKERWKQRFEQRRK